MDATPLNIPPPRRETSASMVESRKQPRHWAIRGMLRPRAYFVYAALGVAAPIGVWIILNTTGSVPRMFMPGPVEVVARFWNWIANEGFAGDFAISIQRVSLGFPAGLVLVHGRGIRRHAGLHAVLPMLGQVPDERRPAASGNFKRGHALPLR